MPYRTFIVWNATGGLLWGTAVVLAGYLAGASYARVEQAIGRDGALVALAVAVVAFVVWRVRRHRRGGESTAPGAGTDARDEATEASRRRS
jgi:membrane protein DedA with SNARE-associated domain